MKIDTILTGAQALTMDDSRPFATRIGIDRGLVVGLDSDLDGCTARTTVDVGQATVTPGFNDVHAHSVWFGLSLDEVDLSAARTFDDIYEAIEHAASGVALDGWIVAAGFDAMRLGGVPRIDVLDRVTQGRKLWIKNRSGHACVVNSVVLDTILHGDTPTQSGGDIIRDADGRPTGLLEENAMRLVQDLVLPYRSDDIERALDRATGHYATEGLTSITDAGIAGGWIGNSPIEFSAYQNAYDAGRLHTRMQPMITIDALQDIRGHDDEPRQHGLPTGIRTGFGDNMLRIGPTKIFTDGSLLGATAAMTEGYHTCPHNHGYMQGDPTDMRRRALDAHAAGWSLALHAIGDEAVDLAIETIREAHLRDGRRTVPNRIEHGGVIRPDQLIQLSELGAVVVPQPHFIATFGDGMAELLGPRRVDWSYRAQSLLASGLVLPGSSDRPVAHGAPLTVIQSFVERLTESGVMYGADERLTALQALRAYTVGSAAATGSAGFKGRIVPGMAADLAFLSHDPTAVDPSEISKIGVLGTLLGGRPTWDSGALSGLGSLSTPASSDHQELSAV
ncbi:amidohydrolase [Rhodococcus sp. 1R11]|uniref:amidohydrolase n=1 Tax=Rhodococcus sp. 1R11 TaxID=2559614 RepID=UPI001072CB72|nr:amidohydrolase [Rhodococcus sp. 1R11]TFI42545.1 amidohydrolase [Rhodococcus sp. 1R11]